MARKMPPDRLERLAEKATQVFIELGYRRTQMADVADALGVAKGTIYLYVESKEALFDLVLRCADATASFAHPRALPIATPKAGATLKYVRERLSAGQPLAALAAAMKRWRPRTMRVELESIVRELYDTLNRNRTAIKLLDRCAHDYPELAAVWYQAGRGSLLDLLARYLETRARQRLLPAFPDPRIAARLIIENVVVWAVHRYWDPAPQAMDDRVAEDMVVDFIVNGLTKREK